MNKRGITLIEVVVAMGLFAVISTIIVGAFVMVLNMKALTSTMKETQQRLRTTIEATSRLARQAKSVKVTNLDGEIKTSGNVVELVFDNNTATKFSVRPAEDFASTQRYTLYSEDCVTYETNTCVSGWANENDMLAGNISLNPTPGPDEDEALDQDKVFTKFTGSVGITPTLSIKLFGKIDNNNSYYSNDFKIDNVVILESIPFIWNSTN